jgi:penicillin-binding protein 2
VSHQLRRAVLLLVVLAVACSGDKQSGATPAAAPAETPGPRATAFEVAQRFLGAWQDARYGDMYALLSPGAKQAISQDRFVARYQGIADEATIVAVKVQAEQPPDSNTDHINYTVTLSTSLWGDLREQNSMILSRGADGWRVDWSPSLIFKNLTGANLVRTVIDAPKRGAILDRGGKPLAITGTVPTVGTAKNLINVPQVAPDREGLISFLSQKIGVPADEIRRKVDDPKTDADLFIPLRTMPVGTPDTLVTELENTPGVLIQHTPRRVYPHGAAAAHVVGYIAPITAEQLEKLRARGYSQGDLVGSVGLEGAYEKELAGERGARLTIITPEGSVAHELAKRPSRPAQDVITTIDIDAQLAAEQALGDRTGSLVVLDPRDSTVVAMTSHPSFDPNAFVGGLSNDDGARLLTDPRRPLINRALAATYPPGSTFKVITAAAGLERGGYTATSRFPCTTVWYGLGRTNPKNNWSKTDEGSLSIAEGLMRSCNPVFYEIALKLDHTDPNILPSVAAGFGLGRPTGINGLDEAAGVDPNPDWKKKEIGEDWFSGDSVNMGIGQGFLLATPLQIANAYSAIAQGGSLRTPLLVREIRESGTNRVLQRFEVKEIGRLPVSAGTLNVLREGTRMVAQDPRGTAYSVFRGSNIDPAGKSGTAEDQGLQSHALFAAYAPRSAARGVAVVVLDEGQSGSLEAGPITRQALEAWLGTGR